jgi:hypothetical protein
MTEISQSPHAIERAEAHAYASAMHQVVLGAKLSGLDALAAGEVDGAPTTIYDLGGDALFYDFQVIRAGEVIGTIRSAATKALGAAVVSVAGGPPTWSEQRGLRLATEALHARTSAATVTGSRLVCYAYPKIAIELSYVVDETTATELFDASSGSIVGSSDDAADQFTRYSLLAHLAGQREERLRSFQPVADRLQQIARLPERPPAVTATARPWPIPLPIITATSGMVLQSPYCPNSPPGNSHYAQITDYFCVDASAQMLMEHYGWNYTQNQIAVAMGTTAAAGGTNQNGLTTGFASLTHNQFNLSFDSGASRAQQFADAVTEVSGNRPLFTQVPHHYRVCMGYSEVSVDWHPLEQWLYIYDPWPWNLDLCQPGAPYWESWSSSPVMWFGIVHHA